MKGQNVLVRYVALVVVCVFAVGILATGGSVKVTWLRFYSAAALVASLGLLLWEHLLWRWKWFQRIPGVPPCLAGTWAGTLESHWQDPDTGERVPPKPVFAIIRQTATTISVTVRTDEMTSRSTSAVLEQEDADWALAYMYLSKPQMAVEHRSRIHHGSTMLELVDVPVTKLMGRYWTDRDTKGELLFTTHNSKKAGDYAAALALHESE